MSALTKSGIALAIGLTFVGPGSASAQPRRGAVINVFRDGVKSASDLPLLEGVPSIPSGQKMGGQFFPLLFDPSSKTLS